MKIQRRRKEKMNNKGMSLVEIVVAMFILAAVTATILSVFVYSIRLNSRSRTRQQTTAAAQTVMENFKAYSVQEIGEQFVAGNFAGNSAVTLQMIDPANPGTPLSAPVSGGNTNFQILGMKYQNEYYDVEVELTSHNLHGHTADMETLIYENRTAENSAAYVGYPSMDADALSKIADEVAILWTNAENAEATMPTPVPTSEPSGDPDPSATPAPAVNHSGSEVDLSQIVITQRVITITVKKDAAGKCVAEVGCKYYYGGNDYQYGVTETATPKTFYISPSFYEFDLDGERAELTKEIFKQPIIDNKNPLENLVIYYYPAYKNHASVKVQEDKIVVDVENTIPNDPEIKCYIYKQRNMNISDVQVSKAELASYRLELDLDTNVKVYDDNLDTILGSPTSSYTYDETGTMTNRYHGIGYAAKKTEYPSPGATPSPVMPAEMSTQTVENLRIMYDIKISVYREGDLLSAGTPLSVLEGTIIE